MALADGVGPAGRHDRGDAGGMTTMRQKLRQMFPLLPARWRWAWREAAVAGRHGAMLGGGVPLVHAGAWSAAPPGTPRGRSSATVATSWSPITRPGSESSHKNVSCIECHFPPGIGGKVRGKMLGLVQLAKYVTKTAGPRPAAEIPDASCLRSGCHETRLLAGRVEFHGDSISTTRRTCATRAAACNCAAPVATARSCRGSTWR